VVRGAWCVVRGAKTEAFEDLIAWQGAHELALEVHRLTARERFSRDFGLKDQMQRAAVSVISNVAEGFERYSRSEFRQFLFVARGSVAEVRSQLHLARSLEYISDADFSKTHALCRDISHLLGALRKSLTS
jgi:four helix bundle protein